MVGYGKRLKDVRTKLGLTQKEFGAKLGLEWHKIKNIETEKHKLTPMIAEQIEQKYSISGWWLLTGKGKMFLAESAANASQIIQGNSNAIGNANIINSQNETNKMNDKERELIEDYRKLPNKMKEYYYHSIKADALKLEIGEDDGKKDSN